MIEKINEAINFIRSKSKAKPEIGIILGTGLGKLAEHVEVDVSLDYKAIPHFAESTVDSHSGKLIFGQLSGKQVVVMHGRFHFYEGYGLEEVTFPIRVMKFLGVHTLLVSNACGAVNPAYKPASLMVIDDHINMLPGNPLIGKNNSALGPRFLDMSRPYDVDLIQKIEMIAAENEIEINKGVYVAWMGPSLETRAEYRFIRTMGADVVGMSTVPEVIVAHHMGIKVAAVSVVTDLCDPDNLKAVDIEDILSNAALAETGLVRIFLSLVNQL